MNNKIEITLPVYNEEKILEKNTQKIIEYLNKNFESNWHITIAENGSSDNTFEVAKEISTHNNNVSVIQTDKGRGNAIKKSWHESNADYLIYMDIDLSTQPEEISKLVSSLKENNIAIGSRFLRKSDAKRTIGRKIISKFYNFIASKVLGLKIKDFQCGFKGIRKDAKYLIESVKDHHWFFDTELIYKGKKDNLKIAQVPISWDERKEETRKSKVNIFIDSIFFLKNIFTLKFENKLAIPAFLLFLFSSGLILFIIKDSQGVICPDSFYHVKITQTIWETKSLITSFPWLPFTILGNNQFVDHHMLYHLFAAPFVGILGFYGIKAVTVILAGGVFTIFYIVLKRLGIKTALIWTLIIFATPSFIHRVILYRAMSLSIILLLISIYFIFKKKYLLLFITSAIFVWSYNAFPVVLIFSILYSVFEKLKNKKISLKPILASLSGILTGIIINPYFPQNLNFYKIHIFVIPFLNGVSNKFHVGAEWYPLEVTEVIKSMTIIWVLFCISIALIMYNSKNRKHLELETLTSLSISIIFFVASVKSQRFIEYWVPFTLLSSALIFKDLKIDKLILDFVTKKSNVLNGLKILILMCFISYTTFSIISTKSMSDLNTNYASTKNAAEWLNHNTEDKTNVINASWDTFPELYYWNNKNNYVAGMDLMFLCSYDRERCDTYNRLIGNENIEDNNYLEKLKSNFNSNIIFTFKNNELYKTLKNSQKFNKLYEDGSSYIVKIK